MRKKLAQFVYLLMSVVGAQRLIALFVKLIEIYAAFLPPKESMRFLLSMEKGVLKYLGQNAQRYDDGVHVKIRLMDYPAFFVKHIKNGERVVDIGTGTGLVAEAIARNHPDSEVLGIDLSKHYVRQAQKRFSLKNLHFENADALVWKPKKAFDVIVMSNILEHFEDRIGLLKQLATSTGAKKILIRVPAYDRHWTVPLMDELEMDYFLDPTHFVEYTLENLADEALSADMQVTFSSSQWGEIWAVFEAQYNHE